VFGAMCQQQKPREKHDTGYTHLPIPPTDATVVLLMLDLQDNDTNTSVVSVQHIDKPPKDENNLIFFVFRLERRKTKEENRAKGSAHSYDIVKIKRHHRI
jgi:hypothetical protein